MEINSVNGINAYTASTLDSEKNQVEDQNKASARSDLGQQEAKAAQQAFEVNISPEAQALADSSSDTAEQQGRMDQKAVEETQASSNYGQDEASRQRASQIVNIVT